MNFNLKIGGAVLVVLCLLILIAFIVVPKNSQAPVTTNLTQETSSAVAATSQTGNPRTNTPRPPSVSQTTGQSVSIIAPKPGDKLFIQKNQTISWNTPIHRTGAIYLTDTSGKNAGWITSNLSPDQTSYGWDGHTIFISRGSPTAKDIVTGTYILHLLFDGPGITANTVSFSLIYPDQYQTPVSTVSIQNFSFVPNTLMVKKGDKVIFRNNDSVSHTLKFSIPFPSQVLAPSQSYTLNTLSLNPGKYEFYSEKYPDTKGALIVE